MAKEVLICVDVGTTNTRVWLMRDGIVEARSQRTVGVRDSAQDGNNARLSQALRELIGGIACGAEARYILAAGMITSSLGLAEIPHVPAPAGIVELAAGTVIRDFPEIADIPFALVPGVRSGPVINDFDSLSTGDLMRGEETLCVGIAASRQLPCLVLNLGSHWKAIRLGADGRIEGSRTTLSGELIHAVQTQTILASALAQGRPLEVNERWAEAGMEEEKRSGLGRALFCVRLLEQSGQGTPEERLAFLIGAVVSSEFSAMISGNVLVGGTEVMLTGGEIVGRNWERLLIRAGYAAGVLGPDEVETAYLAGLLAIWRLRHELH